MPPESDTSLCISATFLSRIYHGRGDGGSEWPPSPFRMFQALTAAAFGGCGDPAHTDNFRAALLWLEKRPPPDIVAPGSQALAPYRLYVPNNDGDKIMREYALGQATKGFSSIRTLKVVEPCLIDEPKQVHFLWRLGGDTPPEIETVRRLARRVSALGPPQDVAVCEGRVISDADIGQLRGERLIAVAEPYGARLLCPKHGSLGELERREKLRRSGTLRRYRLEETLRITYRRADEAPSRPFAAFALRRVSESGGFRAFDQEQCICVSAMVRHVAWQHAAADLGGWRTREWAEQFVAGHQDNVGDGVHSRFSYIPLPSIGGAHADGDIRRVLIAEHVGGDGQSAKWAAARLSGAILLKEPDERQVARLEPIDPSDSVVRRFVGSSADWETVTPVVLPGFDGKKPGGNSSKHIKLLRRCLTDAGYDLAAVESIESRWTAFSPVSVREYRRPRYLQHLPAYHVRIRFRSAISGPLILGAGRHCGLGVFVGTTL